MSINSFSWMIGGPQGSGINVGAETLAKALSRYGYYIFGNIEYHSNIKGKHSYYRLRIADQPVSSHLDDIHLLVALDEETLLGDLYHHYPMHEGHALEVNEGGGILYDASIEGVEERLNGRDVKLFPIEYAPIVERALAEVGKAGQGHEYKIMNNTAAVGAAAALIGMPFEPIADVILGGFKGKSKNVGEMNVHCAQYGYEAAKERYSGQIKFALPEIPKRKTGEGQILIKGTQAVAIAKLKAGLGVQTYYPISPATDESVYLEQHQGDYDLVVLQTEDEVAAIDAAVAAAHGGARASTSTSGPGFALMPEGLGWAAITEAPGPVLCSYQRGGPSTGLPTRQEQGDLRFTIHAGQGDIPRLVMTPGDMEEMFFDTFDAFNYADIYQVPVLILYDRHLAAMYATIPPFDTKDLKIDRGELYDPSKKNGDETYMRYRFNQRGISPRAHPGQEGGNFWATSDEHDQLGHITEGIGNRFAMMKRRMNKMDLMAKEIPADKKFNFIGKDKAPVTILCWGSTKGAVVDALRQIDPDQENYNCIHFRIVHPFPTEIVPILENAGKIVSFDGSYSPQIAQITRENTGHWPHHRVIKYDGRPFSENEIGVALRSATADGPEVITISEGKIIDDPEQFGLDEVQRLVDLRENNPRMQGPIVPLPPGYNR